MAQNDNTAKQLPDVANQAQSQLNGVLDWVGMNQMQLPVMIDGQGHAPYQVSALVDAHVNLIQTRARGIHMSRLYLLAEKALTSEPLSPKLIRQLLDDFLGSHEGLSDQARVVIRFEQLMPRKALKSDHSGWRTYPVTIHGRLDGDQFSLEVTTDILYSSTCPASAALARQLIQQQFTRDFAGTGEPLDRDAVHAWLGSERGMIATPHAQRSVASLRVRPAMAFEFDLMTLVDTVEKALGTPVQTAVKREDEQAFALANGENLLFCEDAARRIQRALSQDESLTDFAVRVSHEESLHPHNAVAYASKGVKGGYDASTVFAQ